MKIMLLGVSRLLLAGGFLIQTFGSLAQPVRTEYKLSFGESAAGYTRVPSTQAFNAESGFGFEKQTKLDGEHPFYFSVAVPEGNYKVTIKINDAAKESVTTVKAELRRLMLEGIRAHPGEIIQRSFIVNVRTPIFPGSAVRLKAPRETKDEAWAWDEKLTLEFNGTHPGVSQMEIAKVDVPTIYILGDSTVCDQSKEPYASWGQMLPRFFKPEIAVANHAESGETLSSSQGAHRFEKVLSSMKAGDYLLIQFGHNDMKSKSPTASQDYKATLKKWVSAVKAKGGIPVLVTPVNRHSFEGETVLNSLRDYPEKVREAAREENVALIDLNAMSKTLYEALGAAPSIQLFEHNADSSKLDGTHHSPYGAYELAKCVIEGMKLAKLDVVRMMAEDVPSFDPAKPDPVASFAVPPSPGDIGLRPLGD